jgi:large subunit ribosomal protein L15
MLNELRPDTQNKKGKTVGRGGKRGKTAGRGTKGQKARAGHKIRPHIRDMIKKLPKLRGRGKNTNKAFRERPATVNLISISKMYKKGEVVSPRTLIAKKLISLNGGKTPVVKILGTGELTVVVRFHNCLVSDAAKLKIEGSGSTIVL